jgi:DNA mismatch endonuclease (patch repair protein)
MRAVRRERTNPELAVARFLRARGVRFRTNVRSLPGSPDLANKTKKLAIYVHGCFWHRHAACKKATTPKQNAEFWRTKFEQNVARDRRKVQALRDLGFEVAVVWECEAGNEKRLDRVLRKVIRRATNPSTTGRDDR